MTKKIRAFAVVFCLVITAFIPSFAGEKPSLNSIPKSNNSFSAENRLDTIHYQTGEKQVLFNSKKPIDWLITNETNYSSSNYGNQFLIKNENGDVYDFLCYVACRAGGGNPDFCRVGCRVILDPILP